MEDLPVAAPPPVRKLTAVELNKVRQREEATLRELRLFLRDILNKLVRDRRFAVFARPVDPAEVCLCMIILCLFNLIYLYSVLVLLL